MKIKYFAWIKDITKEEENNLKNYPKNIRKLKIYLINKYPDLKKHILK